MRYVFVMVFTCISLVNSEDFITKTEYAKLLYSNPRGIGCNKCHGDYGEGSIIASYKHKGKDRVLVAPKISNLDKKTFTKAIERPKSVMPNYSLTKEEIESLYSYVNSQNQK